MDNSIRKYTLVTVVFEDEIDLLKLQARSCAKYASIGLIDSVIVIDNSKNAILGPSIELMRAQYGALAPILQVVPANDIVELPSTRGWISQQILKLMICRLVKSERFILLDAKTHFTHELTRDFLESQDGRALMAYERFDGHVLEPHLDKALTYFDLNDRCSSTRFPDTVTPFIMYRDAVARLIETVERREGKPFAESFEEKGFTEFFLYSAYLFSTGEFRDLYADSDVRFPVIWPHRTRLDYCLMKIDQSSNESLPFFSVHRRAIVDFRADSRMALSSFWARQGLFSSESEAMQFLRALQSKLKRKQRLNMVTSKLRSIGRRFSRVLSFG